MTSFFMKTILRGLGPGIRGKALLQHGAEKNAVKFAHLADYFGWSPVVPLHCAVIWERFPEWESKPTTEARNPEKSGRSPLPPGLCSRSGERFGSGITGGYALPRGGWRARCR